MQATLTKPALNEQPALTQAQLFPLVKALASSQSIIITAHARQRMSQRCINSKRLMDILTNPTRLIKTEINQRTNDVKYTIRGGKCKRTTALTISENNLIIITVM